jgi:hypothetical protein
MQYAIAEECFSLEEIRSLISKNMNDRKIRDALNTMVDQGWLSKETDQAHKWHPGSHVNNKSRPKPEEHIQSVSDVDYLEQGRMYVGTVDRFSSSGNAIIKIPSDDNYKIMNLGPIDEAADSEKVKFRVINGTWGECLNEEYRYDGYDPREDGSSSSTSSPSSSSVTASKKNPVKRSSGKKNELLGGHL